MALDWKKELSFSGLKKGKSKTNSAYPSKTYMNLTVQNKRQMDVKRSIPLAIVLIVVVALFAKFGVLDFYGRVAETQSELNQRQSILSDLNQHLVGYDALLEEYESYDTEHLVAGDSTVSAMDALGLVDRVVAPNARVESLGYSGNVLTLSVSEITLDSAGSLVSLLYKDPLVANVTVSTASNQTQNDSAVTTAMTVTLQREE